MSRVSQVLSQYQYNQNKPTFKYSGLQIFDAKHKQTLLPYTIKILSDPDPQLEDYFRQIKSVASDYVVKIYEISYEVSQRKLILVQESTPYGTLKNALNKCKRLDDDDSVFLAKMMLNGHIDLLRQGVTWFGNQNDIQFTENGMKLSWNNGIRFSSVTPFPEIIRRIGVRTTSSSILPFPKNKVLNDLIEVSKENASEISLHPALKKKDKLFKKKGKDWLAIKQIKTKGEYFQEVSYLAISPTYGFVRVKMMDTGEVDEKLMKIYQTKAAFVKILDFYKEKNLFITISQYANDGTVQNYVRRLKTSNMALKQSQIQFFFFSVIQPLKFIHASSVESLNMLHIRNLYIQDGIPKIGQPIPMHESLKQQLTQRADVPDFYHSSFKNDPNSRNPIYDTYSIGVLLYKLMYTEYPIFPEGNVHVPTAPNYKRNLKAAVELFLNVGGNLQQLERQLEISDDVKLQVRKNEKVLEEVTKKNTKQQVKQQTELQFKEQEQQEVDDSQMGCCGRFWRSVCTKGKDPDNKYKSLHESPYNGYRLCVSTLLVLLMYIFTFFFMFLQGVISLLTSTRLFAQYKVNILGQEFSVITTNFETFVREYEEVMTGEVDVLNSTMKCVVDDADNTYYDFIRPDSPHWNLYLVLSIITMVIILLIKGIQLCRYSTGRVGYHHYDNTINGSNQSKFAISTWVFFQLWFAMALYGFYYIFNYVYKQQHSPCFGGVDWTLPTQTLFSDRMEFSLQYLIIVAIAWLFGLLSFIHILRYEKFKYGMLCNPIFIFTPFYLALFIIMRIGALESFEPSFLRNSSGIIGSSYMDIVGYFPELLIILELGLCLLIDMIFFRCVNKSIDEFVKIRTHSSELKLDE